MHDKTIQLDKLTKDFGKLRAVDSLSIDVPTGSIFGFLGPNGAGKTTTLHMLLGLLEPTSGGGEVMGYDLRTDGDQIRACCGALLEHHGLYEALSAADNLEFYGRAFHLPDGERQKRIQELLEQIGLWERRKEAVGSWSKGMKQKLAIARAMLHKPGLILLDEPTAGLDVVSAVEVRKSLDDLAGQQGVTVFMTTHNMTEAEKLCDQVAVIRAGKLLAEGKPDELRRRSRKPSLEIAVHGMTAEAMTLLQAHPLVASAQRQDGHLRVDLSEDKDAAPLMSLLVGAGVQVSEVHRSVASLEDVYLELFKEEDNVR
jgi:ABC-2 type transport system ATP-binding protein